MSSILIANLVVSIISVGWAATSVLRPTLLSGTIAVDHGEIFYARMYGARAVPFGLLSGILPFYQAGWTIAAVLLIAALMQLLDVAIALDREQYRMALGASVGTVVPVVCGLMIVNSN